jgi:hypothetical protein
MKMRFHRGNQARPEIATSRTCSVHVLRDEGDLREALRRAAEFDQRTADVLLSRSAHYRALRLRAARPGGAGRRRSGPDLTGFETSGGPVRSTRNRVWQQVPPVAVSAMACQYRPVLARASS